MAADQHDSSVDTADRNWPASGTPNLDDLGRDMHERIAVWWEERKDQARAETNARLRKYNRTRPERRHDLARLSLSLLELGERDGWRCYWSALGECQAPDPVIEWTLSGMEPFGPSIEHIIPIATGGTNDPDNLSVSHRRCNVSHGARRP